MSSNSKEAKINLTIAAIQQNPKLGIREAARIYTISSSTLHARMNGRRARVDTHANSMRLTLLEEQTLVKFILDLDSRGFPPQLNSIEEMANLLLAECNIGRIGQHWASHFIQRQPKLKMRFNCVYNWQRALCEDLTAIDVWF
jgi:hypothetical protein